MFVQGAGHVVLSASDLTAAAGCEFAVLRALDARLGRIQQEPAASDPMLEQVAKLGDRHELAVLNGYRAGFGVWDGSSGVAVVERPERWEASDATVLAAKHTETLALLHTGADVVHRSLTRFPGHLS